MTTTHSGVSFTTAVNDSAYGGPLQDFTFEPVHAPFLRRAAADPHRVAIRQSGREATYGELASMALSVSTCLKAAGLRTSDRLGVCVDRSIEATAVMLGVFQSGVVYVPIDVRNPRARVEHVLRTSSITTVLASDPEMFAGIEGLSVIEVGAALAEPGDLSSVAELTGAEEAYVIYTSGTTGAPKGVVGKHLQLSRQMHGWAQIGYDLGTVRGALIASYGFDSSFLEHFLTLNGGGRLSVFETQDILDTDALAARIDAEGIEFAILSPALLPGVASYFERTSTPLPLRTLISGGEGVPNEALQRYRTLAPEIELCVGYGTTEATVAISTHRFDPSDVEGQYSPIGRPMPGYHLLLLDEAGCLVGPGVIGEVHVSGDVLAAGYDGNPEETARRFVDNPYFAITRHEDRHRVMYRTGDLARVRPDGVLIYEGRVDNQVQVRGLRVELGEVEAGVTAAFDGACHCGVFTNADGARSIAAYVVSGSGVDPSAGLDALEAALPEYMLPSHLVFLDELPVNINDKIDKRRLPAPTDEDRVARYRASAGSAPADAVSSDGLEADLIVLAASILSIDGRIGVDDRFTDLGADSLRIVRLVVETQRAFSAKLPVKQMRARELTPRSLAQLIREHPAAVTVSAAD